MSELIIAPAADGIVQAYLDDALTPVPVSTQVPDPRPSSFVTVLLTGGGGRRGVVLQDSQVTVECWAATEGAAATLMMLADAHMNRAPYMADSGIRAVSTLGGATNLPDPDSGQARFTATYIVTVRASA